MELGAADRQPRVQDGVLPFRVDPALIGQLAMGHHHPDRSAEVLFIEPERLGASAGEIHVGVEPHLVSVPSLPMMCHSQGIGSNGGR